MAVLVDETFDVALVESSSQSDYWENALSVTHVPLAVKVAVESDSHEAKPFVGAIRRRWLGDIALMDGRSGPFRGKFDQSRIKEIDGDYIQLVLPTAGSERIARVGGLEIGIEQLVISSTRSAYQFEVPTGICKRTLRLPRAGVEVVLGRRWESAPVAVIARTESPVRLLEGYLDVVDGMYATMTALDAMTARNAALELIAGIIRFTENRSLPTPAPALRPMIESWIDVQLLMHADLSAQAAAAAHHVSVRTLHRLFSGDGLSFAELVRAHRLEHARSDLVRTSDSVQKVANRWGFADASHFCRLFKRQFTMTPNDYRYTHSVTEDLGGVLAAVR
ncbi:hypothetical protein CJ178_31680 [Rhodococcus sp. ACPA4]|uniref:AraC family transcriptional regulator n=1 Tax=Rhodococcus sp. ACPA4 TaxID=2028571 RepID=UPI000BB0F7BD|nr:AraC family transcriptional regulator [Rhodococcus sp. ACPA4]PBC35985.1 hypothetical protein CJ178_31680 [Rhodococcus sp. ACPA4]